MLLFYVMQQTANLKESIQFSVGLVVICFILLMLLWLPDMLNKD